MSRWSQMRFSLAESSLPVHTLYWMSVHTILYWRYLLIHKIYDSCRGLVETDFLVRASQNASEEFASFEHPHVLWHSMYVCMCCMIHVCVEYVMLYVVCCTMYVKCRPFRLKKVASSRRMVSSSGHTTVVASRSNRSRQKFCTASNTEEVVTANLTKSK